MGLSNLRRKFYDALDAGRQIFGIFRAKPRKHPIPLSHAAELSYLEERPVPQVFAELLPLFFLLNLYGVHTPLYILPAGREQGSDMVALRAPRIQRGYVDEFIIRPDLKIKDYAAWLRIGANASWFDKGSNSSFRKP